MAKGFEGSFLLEWQRDAAQRLNSIISSEKSAILIGADGIGKATIARFVAEHFRSRSAIYFSEAADVDMTYLTEAVRSFPSSQHILIIADIPQTHAALYDALLVAVKKGIEGGHTFILTANTMPPELKDTINLEVVAVSHRTHTGNVVSVPLKLFIDPGDASTETLQEVFEALSELNVACGGLGLTFKTDGKSVYAISEAET